MTAKDQDGKVLLTERRKYENWNLWFEGRKEVALQLWDITATASINLGLEPGQPDSKTNVIVLNKDTKKVNVEVKFLFEHTPDNWETVKTVTHTYDVFSSDKYYPPRQK